MADSESVSDYNRIVKSSIIVFLALLFSKIFSYGYKITIARHFGPQTFGFFSIGLVIIGVISSISAMGLSDGLVRQIAIYRSKKKYKSINILINWSLILLSLLSIIGLIIIYLFAPYLAIRIFHEPSLIQFIRIMSFALPFLILANVFLAVLKAYEKITLQSTLINIVQNGLRFFVLILLIFFGFNQSAVAWSYVVAYIGLFLSSSYFAIKLIKWIKVLPEDSFKKIFVNALQYSWPLMFVALLYSIFYWTDSLVIGYFLDSNIVGVYNSAVTIVAFFGVAPELFIQLFFPMVTIKLSQGKNIVVRNLTQRVTKSIFFLNSILLIICILFPNEIITIIFGNKFIQASTSLQILAIGGLFTSLAGFFTLLLTIKGKTKTVLFDFIVLAIFNLVGNIIFVPLIGMNGASIMTVLSSFILCILTTLQIMKAYSFKPISLQSFYALILFLLLISIAIFAKIYFSLNSWIIGIIAIFIYLISLVYIGFFDIEDKILMNKIITRLSFLSTRNNSERE